MKILEKHSARSIKVAIFDFDGTLSTLRCGWESVMAPLMEECLDKTPNVKEKVREFIDRSTGIQTILQMKWLAEQVALQGDTPLDIWEYKAEYNRRLMESVAKKRDDAINGAEKQYTVENAEEFLDALCQRGIRLFAASGTDDADVKREAAALKLDKYFESIDGAKPFSEDCSKEATLKALMSSFDPESIIVIGDGPVEIKLGRSVNALTLGICADERKLCGYDEAKISRLTAAGAHALVDGFKQTDEIISWMEE